MVHDPSAETPRCRLQEEDSEEYGPPIVPETTVAAAIKAMTEKHLAQTGGQPTQHKPSQSTRTFLILVFNERSMMSEGPADPKHGFSLEAACAEAPYMTIIWASSLCMSVVQRSTM